MTITEKFQTVSAEEFGRRMAQALHDSKSSTALFFIQQALKDCEDDNGIYWELFDKMLTRIKGESLQATTEGKDCDGSIQSELEAEKQSNESYSGMDIKDAT